MYYFYLTVSLKIIINVYIVKGTKVLYAFFRLISLPLSSKKSPMLHQTNKVDEKRLYQDTMRYGLMLKPDKRSLH